MPASDSDIDMPDTGPPVHPPPGADPGAADVRSASLLPAGGDDADERFAVAEEVSLDQQSDQARRVGALPPDPAPQTDLAGSVAATLSPDETAQPPPAAGGHATSRSRA
ncbi:hypothetical protein [Massilia sp. CCM 8734]|uniref:hypothetical protein n=1 Tax=Massilia sp. CCM 8734 TaxID=2609283 RepID=UPI00141F6B43|nr:hypothetical protein [Massilia sp. CCM 8734]NHZ98005.1 hypothetical protein [Massilia sp. CCM 8734]